MENQIKVNPKIMEVLEQIGNPKYIIINENSILINNELSLKYNELRDEFKYRLTTFMKVENLIYRIKSQMNKTCIFEKKYCRFANNENGSFDCKCKSDEEMPCKKK